MKIFYNPLRKQLQI